MTRHVSRHREEDLPVGARPETCSEAGQSREGVGTREVIDTGPSSGETWQERGGLTPKN